MAPCPVWVVRFRFRVGLGRERVPRWNRRPSQEATNRKRPSTNTDAGPPGIRRGSEGPHVSLVLWNFLGASLQLHLPPRYDCLYATWNVNVCVNPENPDTRAGAMITVVQHVIHTCPCHLHARAKCDPGWCAQHLFFGILTVKSFVFVPLLVYGNRLYIIGTILGTLYKSLGHGTYIS